MEKYHNHQFGDVVRSLRKERNLSQEGLAGSSSLNRTYISSLERGLKTPSLDTIFALAVGLETRAYQIIKKMEEDSSQK